MNPIERFFPGATPLNLAALSHPEPTAAREPPHNIEAEQALLGAILVNNEAMECVTDFLLRSHFYEPLHGQIYEACLKQIGAGRRATPITLKPFFEREAPIGELTVPQYLARLCSHATTVINARDYGQTIHDLAMRREMIQIGEQMINAAYDAVIDSSPREQIEIIEKKLYGLSTGVGESVEPLDNHVSKIISAAEKAYRLGTGITGISTGIAKLDKITGGLSNGDMIILGGRPSMGKSALAGTIANNVAKAGTVTDDGEVIGVPVAFFSLEMSAEGLARRELAAESGVSGSSIKRGLYTEEEYLKMLKARSELSKLPLWIVKLRDATVSSMKSCARKLIREKGVGFIVIDYLGLVRCNEGRGTYEKTTMVSKEIKTMLSDLNVPGLVLCQLSRDVEKRENKRPQMTDLRDTGAIEQDADVVMFIHREEYYLARNEPDPKDAEKHAKWNDDMDRWRNRGQILLPKQREGEIGDIEVGWDAARSRFFDLDAA